MRFQIFTAFLLLSTVVFGQNRKERNLIVSDLTFLAHDSLEGREMGTKGEEIASEFITNRYIEIGLSPLPGLKGYNQFFSKKTKAHPHDTLMTEPEISGRNVIGYIDNHSEHSIVIGAHYDHLGWGEHSSLSSTRAIHNGADDNASGVAALLYLAKKLNRKKLAHNVIFIAFTGEEKGLLGSNYFVNETDISLEDISFMINMDMIGRLDSNRRLAINGVGTSSAFIPKLNEINESYFQLKLDSSGMGPSDHTSFYLNEVPVLHFLTGQHAQYHKPEDDVELINFDGLYSVSDFIFRLTKELDKHEDLAFQKTRDVTPGKRSFKVTLGIIPDYLFDGQGLKIDGVKDDRPAKVHGLIRGDIVIQMGEIKINSMNDYMKALGRFNPEQTIELKYLRDGIFYSTQLTFD